MKTSEAKRLEFRRNLETGTFMIAPGIYDALSAKIAGCRAAFSYRDAGIAEADL